MTTLLTLQILYLIPALGYNVLSFVLLRLTGTGLAQTSPIFGFAMVALIVGPCIAVGWMGWMKAHAIYALFVSLVFCFIGGTLPHVRAYLTGDLSNYASVASLAAAAFINFFGALTFLASAARAWRRSLSASSTHP